MKVNDYFVVARRVEKPEKEGGIILTKETRQNTNRAEVIAVAENMKDFVKEKEVVVFNPLRGVTVEEHNAIVLHKNDIYFVE